MDDLTEIRDFRAECAGDPRARAAALRALEARFQMALETGAEAEAPARPDRTRPRPRRRSFGLAGRRGAAAGHRRGLLALGGAALVAAIVAVAIVVGSGSTAAPAAAEVLRRTAVAAAGGRRQPLLPGPGQFVYAKSKTVEIEGWIPGGPSSRGGQMRHPKSAFNALVPTTDESWSSADTTRIREKMTGPPRFFSNSEQRRWKQAGSPLPGQFDPANQRPEIEASKHQADNTITARRGLFDMETTFPKGRGRGPNLGFPDVSGLPTRPEALRRTVERNQDPKLGLAPKGDRLNEEDTIFGLWGIVSNPSAGPALRAACFNALGELPGIELRTDAVDLAGRSGDAIRYVEAKYGWAVEDIFDPTTSEVLGDRQILVDPGKSPSTISLPKGLVISSNAYLGGRIVDSTHER